MEWERVCEHRTYWLEKIVSCVVVFVFSGEEIEIQIAYEVPIRLFVVPNAED